MNHFYQTLLIKTLRYTALPAIQQVRISKYKNLFEKEYTPNWTTEIFKVKLVNSTNSVTFVLEDLEGNPIKCYFYKEELQSTRFPNVYLVEKVLKTKGNQAYVQWLGFASNHNSWINKKN